MSVPPQPMQPGEGGSRRETVPAISNPDIDQRIKRFLKVDGQVLINGKITEIDKDGYVDIFGTKYIVLEGIKSPETGIRLPLGVNAIFDKSCEVMGKVEAKGRVHFLGPVEVKGVTASSIKFEEGIASWDLIHSREGNLEGRGDVRARQVKARDNISVYGDIDAQLVMASDGFLQANSITGEAILGGLGVNAMTGTLGYGPDKPAAERPISLVWSSEGRIYAASHITTGKICAGLDIQTSGGDLNITGDAYCLGAKINGQVLDAAGNDASERVYSRYAWECKDAEGRHLRKEGKEIPVEKLERTPFAIDRWKQYYERYLED